MNPWNPKEETTWQTTHVVVTEAAPVIEDAQTAVIVKQPLQVAFENANTPLITSEENGVMFKHTTYRINVPIAIT